MVVVVGAYVRLSDAGLGCPDWPLCYGQPASRARSPTATPLAKAWKEMGAPLPRRTLGILIVRMIADRLAAEALRSGSRASILALVLFQATLGMWT